jgi:hypothetical protein
MVLALRRCGMVRIVLVRLRVVGPNGLLTARVFETAKPAIGGFCSF